MKSVIPAGRYLAEKVRRRTLPEEERGGIEFTFRIARGEYRGELVSTRLWATGRIERADKLGQGELVEIVVVLNAATSGRRFATVQDFRRLAEPTAADTVRGEDAVVPRIKPGDGQETAGTFEPYLLLTHYELEQALEHADEEAAASDFPVLDDDTVDRVTSIAQSVTDPTLFTTHATPDACDDDDDDDHNYRWGIARTGSDMPIAVRIATEEILQELPAAKASIGVPALFSLFQYTADLPSYMAAHRQCSRGYSGLAWSRWLTVRLLTKNGLDSILEKVRIIASTCVKLGLPSWQIIVINSWNCGLSVLIPSCAAEAYPKVGYEKIAGHFVQALADLACMHTCDAPMQELPNGLLLPRDRSLHVPIDRQLYGPVAIHPVLNSPDDSGTHFAVALSYDELLHLDANDIEALATAPRHIPMSTWHAEPVEDLVALWQYAVNAEQLRSRRFSHLDSETPFVHADTYDWMLHGSGPDMAPKRLFRAAVNLLRVGCSRNAVVALLHPATHLSGLGRDDLEWGVDCAVKTLIPGLQNVADDE